MTISMIYVFLSVSAACHLRMFTILLTSLPLYSSNCHPPPPATASARSSLRSCKLWSLMIVTHRATTITLLSCVLVQAVLLLSCWTCSCGEATKLWRGGGQLIRGSFHTPFYLLCTAASNGLMQLSTQFIGASVATCLLLLCEKPLRSATTVWEITNALSACSRVYCHAKANPSFSTANRGQSLS